MRYPAFKSLTKATEAARPAYLIAGFGGHVLEFRPLARAIADKWHLIGVHYPIFAGGSDNCSSIAALSSEMAAHFDDVEGPIVLIGYSIGGTFAYHIATLLRQDGKDVSVVLIDTTINALRAKRGPFVRALQTVLLTWPRRLAGRPERKAAPLWQPDEPRLRNFTEECRVAMIGYRPPDSDVPVVMIRADVHRHWRRWLNGPFWPSRTHGWSRVAPVSGVVRCPGNHLTIIAPENLGALSKAADAALQLAYDSLCRSGKDTA